MTVSDETAEATLRVSRSLLGVIARSLGDALERVTLPQFRVLVLLISRGPLRMRDLADSMGAVPSTFTRVVDRLESSGWVARSPGSSDRREVLISATPAARQLVDEVTERRRRRIAAILSELSSAEQEQLRDAFLLFTTAAGEPAAEDLLIMGL
ncbi:MarR family transcriptional regulator [Rathayibacter sp. VKM Ac-2759]|uniref:MarR family transcriptional regulator n=1 Tax=Rathayibacter sp. VKM Ac-2759 TaxID=2609252 RepID=UPI0013175426|nr:MarR family transcriptional regulator [Rathayibacter sp. VKM Ac-2759]QHC65505.1 MarR family transcriptional regulator [Rathayibacter sp. VKM Ac-2759]